MRRENLTIGLLLIIAIALVAIAVQPVLAPHAAEAQSTIYPLYIEPGSELLRAPDGSKPGLWKGNGGHAHRQDLGISHTRTPVLPYSRTAEQTADFPPVRAGKVRL